MVKRKCLMTFYPTDCKDNCFNCKCGGAEATKDMYVSIHDVQRVCAITGGAADTDEGEHIAEVIRNNLENMVMPAADVQPIKRVKWITKAEDYYKAWQDSGRSWDDMPYFVTGLKFACSNCFEQFDVNAEGVEKWNGCPLCLARMDGGEEDENS